VKEVTLLGQNVNSYAWRREEAFRFSSLLRELNKLHGLARIRFTTSHPKDLSDDLIHCFGELKNLCPHIHLPLQAGSNKILALMNRGYTREKYRELTEKLRKTRPDIAISSDVMVGFPKESHEDFELTLDLISQIEFDSLYSFKYSDRKGTLAETMDGKISEPEKSSRLTELQEIQKAITLKKNRSLEGQELEILVEGESKKGGQLTGRTITNKIVNFSNNNSIIGELVNVTIKRASVNSMWGILTVISTI
jgi:tRNA-2-methylthio-N6-dimethylallyladenosine synthase